MSWLFMASKKDFPSPLTSLSRLFWDHSATFLGAASGGQEEASSFDQSISPGGVGLALAMRALRAVAEER